MAENRVQKVNRLNMGNDAENKVKKMEKRCFLPSRRPALGDLSNRLQVLSLNGNPEANKIIDNCPSLALEKVPSVEVLPDSNQTTEQTKTTIVERLSISSKRFQELCNIDVDPDPEMVSEYVKDIFQYMIKLEKEYTIPEGYLTGHMITSSMRNILIVWLAQVHQKFDFLIETLYLCVNILDRFVNCTRPIASQNYQLVGITALFIAAKVEEIQVPTIDEFVQLCSKAYTKKMVLQMERRILSQLEFKFSPPTSILFLRRFSKVAQSSNFQHNLAKYIMELSLAEYKFCHVAPSLLAAAATCVQLALHNSETNLYKIWTKSLEHFTSYKLDDFKALVPQLATLLMSARNLPDKFLLNKYALPTYSRVSTSELLRGATIKSLSQRAIISSSIS